MNRAIVTGATGFLGRRLVERLLKHGVEVVAIGNTTTQLAELNHPLLSYQRADIVNKRELFSVIKVADVVFHCAAFSSDWGDKNKFDQVNRLGSQNLIECCEEIGIKRLIYVSSASVYFNFKDQLGLKEGDLDTTWFVNAYARSKYLGEQAVLSRQRTTQVIIVRPRGIVGQGDTTIAPRIVSILKRGYFPIVNQGQALIDLTTVDNVVMALIQAAEWEGVSNEIFNVTNDQAMTVRQLIEIFIRVRRERVKLVSLPKPIAMGAAHVSELTAKILKLSSPTITRYGMGLISVSQTLNIDKAKNALNYSPMQNLEEVLTTVAAEST